VYTRTALARGASLVVAIDPASEPAECLRRNFKQEIAAGRVIVYQKGVWNTETSLELRTNPGMASTANSVAIDRGEGGEIVSLTTIDKLVEELNLERVDFIKMDIEGAESEALQGAVDTVAKFHPRMAVSLEHRPTDPDRIPVLIVELYPDYEYAFSDCVSINGSIQPDVLFLTP
jgi:FkbM family methyltransferase